jgi:hypothetical protein
MCPECGDPLDGFSACPCVFEGPPRRRTALQRAASMRQMVARKLERERAKKGQGTT